MSTWVLRSPRRTLLMASCSSLMGSTTLMMANAVPMKPVASAVSVSASTAGMSSPGRL